MMKAKKVMSTAMAMLMLAGCGGSGKVEYTAEYDTKNFKDYIVAGKDFESLNYLTSYLAVDGRLTTNFVDYLITTDRYGQTIPCLAESWSHNDDYSVWTFNLRKGVQWMTRDGKAYGEVTADDFVYSVEYILNPDNVLGNLEMTFLIQGAKNYYQNKLDGKKADMKDVGVKAIDDYTVQYTMENGGKPYFISAAQYSSFRPANRQFIESIPDKDGIEGTRRFGSTADLILYCGPYVMEDYTRDNSKTLVKNENYWDKEAKLFDTVSIISIKDEESALEYFERGELHYAPLSATQVVSQQNKGNQYLVQQDLSRSVYGMLMNNAARFEGAENSNKAVNNENFRKALFYGIDADQYNEVSTPGDVTSVRAYGFTAQNFVTTEDGRDYTSLGKLGEWQEYHFNPKLAQEYRDKAREELSAQGVTFPIKFVVNAKSGDETGTNKLVVFKSVLEEVLGEDFIDVQIESYSQSWYTDVRDKGNYSVYIVGWSPDYKDPINVLNTMTNTSGQINDAYNLEGAVTHFDIPKFTQMVEEANAITTDTTKRYTAFANAEAYLLEHAYFVPMLTAGGNYQVTTINRYTKAYTGGDSTRYVNWDVKDHAITTEEMAGYREEWEAKRKELGLAQ